MKITKHGRVIIDMETRKITTDGYCMDAEGGTLDIFKLTAMRQAAGVLDDEINRAWELLRLSNKKPSPA